MKKIFTFAFFLVLANIAFAQIPKQINYQGVARNAQGQALANQSIKVRASLIDDFDNVTKKTFYSETRTVTTNQLGLFSFKIGGNGAATNGFITNGNWLIDAHSQHLKIELDVNNSGTWTDMGTQQIVSVPLAMYADSANVAISAISTQSAISAQTAQTAQTAITAKNLETPVTSFTAVSSVPQEILTGEGGIIDFETTVDGSSNFFTSVNEFTAINAGMHHFTGTVYGHIIGKLEGAAIVRIYINSTIACSFTYNYLFGEISKTMPFSAVLNLKKGDKVSVHLKNETTGKLQVGAGSTYFSGHNIR